VAGRYDAGVRLGEQVGKDMIAVRIGPDARMAVVGAPAYFERRPPPKRPQDLIAHDCINLRLPTFGGLYAWEFEKGERELQVRVEGQLVFNGIGMMLHAALAGFGLAYLPEDEVRARVADEKLIRVLVDWCRLFPGTISITRAVARPRPPSPYCSKRCAGSRRLPAPFSEDRTSKHHG
jgi:DNA-binding transcriptional LysR family regulator